MRAGHAPLTSQQVADMSRDMDARLNDLRAFEEAENSATLARAAYAAAERKGLVPPRSAPVFQRAITSPNASRLVSICGGRFELGTQAEACLQALALANIYGDAAFWIVCQVVGHRAHEMARLYMCAVHHAVSRRGRMRDNSHGKAYARAAFELYRLAASIDPPDQATAFGPPFDANERARNLDELARYLSEKPAASL